MLNIQGTPFLRSAYFRQRMVNKLEENQLDSNSGVKDSQNKSKKLPKMENIILFETIGLQ